MYCFSDGRSKDTARSGSFCKVHMDVVICSSPFVHLLIFFKQNWIGCNKSAKKRSTRKLAYLDIEDVFIR